MQPLIVISSTSNSLASIIYIISTLLVQNIILFGIHSSNRTGGAIVITGVTAGGDSDLTLSNEPFLALVNVVKESDEGKLASG